MLTWAQSRLAELDWLDQSPTYWEAKRRKRDAVFFDLRGVGALIELTWRESAKLIYLLGENFFQFLYRHLFITKLAKKLSNIIEVQVSFSFQGHVSLEGSVSVRNEFLWINKIYFYANDVNMFFLHRNMFVRNRTYNKLPVSFIFS